MTETPARIESESDTVIVGASAAGLAVAWHPAPEAEIWQAREPLARVEVQAVVVLAPHRGDVWRLLEQHERRPGAREAGGALLDPELTAAAALDADGAPARSGAEILPGLYCCGFHVSPTGMLRDIAREAAKVARAIVSGSS